MTSSFDDVDKDKVINFLQISNISHEVGDISKDLENTLLNRLNVAKIVDGEFKLTNTGVLFFSKSHERFIPQNEIRMIRFRTNIPTTIDDKLYLNSSICDILR